MLKCIKYNGNVYDSVHIDYSLSNVVASSMSINVLLSVFIYHRPDLKFNAQFLIRAPCNDHLDDLVCWDMPLYEGLGNMYKMYYRLIF